MGAWPANCALCKRKAKRNQRSGLHHHSKNYADYGGKNFIAADKTNRSHVYQALLPEEATQQQLLDKFLDTTFRGSAMKLVMQALGNHRTSEAELNQIRNLLDKLEGGQK